MRIACKMSAGKPNGKRQLGRDSRRPQFYIKMDLGEVISQSLYLTHLAKDRDRWRVVMSKVIKFRLFRGIS
jgi:hypothetical protein